ncbi:hypothetical protein GCM10027168_16920 [Streptomyces capparidis]
MSSSHRRSARRRADAGRWPRVAVATGGTLLTVGAAAVLLAAVSGPSGNVAVPDGDPHLRASFSPGAESGTPSRAARPTRETVTAPSAPASSAAASATRGAEDDAEESGPPATAGASSPPAPSAPPPAPGAGPLRAAAETDPNSSRYWSAGNLTVTATEQLTALTVDVRLAQTGGVEATGQWSSLSADDFHVTTRREGEAVVLRWTLKPGRTVPAGTHTFTVQYTYGTDSRAPGEDSYSVQGKATKGTVRTSGTF